MQQPRPYFHNLLKELQELFAKSQNDSAILVELDRELEHRGRPAAIELRSKVRNRLSELNLQSKPAALRTTPESEPLHLKIEENKSRPTEQSKLEPKPEDESKAKAKTKTKTEANSRRDQASSDDQHLRRPTHFKRIEPLGVTGRPPKYVRNPKTDVVLDIRPNMPRAARYVVALGALIADMRSQKHGSRQIVLEDGERISLDRGHFGYSFAFTEDVELFEDARIEIRIGTQIIDGQIVSISDGRIIIAIEEDFGETIGRCTLMIDNTALLVALKERLEKAGVEGRALNTKLADDVVSNSGPAIPADQSPLDTIKHTNEKQRDAVRLALTNEVTYIWGPPGTGKTTTLSALVKEFFARNKRVLICSNTNQAVDQVLLNLCRSLGTDHPAMEKGQIVRLGRIVHEELNHHFAEFVTLDGIVERRSRELKEHKTRLETTLADIARRAAATEAALNRFAEYDRARTAVMEIEREIVRLRNEGQSATRRRDDAQLRLGNLDHELQKTKSAGTFRRAFMRSETKIVADIELMKSHIGTSDLDAKRLLNLYKAAQTKSQEIIARADDLARNLGNVDRSNLQKQMDTFATERQPLLNDLAIVNKALADIEAAVMRDAAVIGATVTKSYLSAKDLPAFDVVVVDEASMVLLPALYFAVGLGREKAIISGDFRQLPPIIQTEQKAILDEIGKDVFHAAGVAIDAGQTNPRLVMLEEQHRMHKSICDLISGPMYGGKLRTSAEVKARPEQTLDPISGPLAIIDTSSLWPFESQTASFSRYNLVHALVVRNLFYQLHKAGHVSDIQSLGICTPYTAQAKLIRRLIEDEDTVKGVVEAGTVHRYQGDEKTTIIIDIPESVGGGRFIGRFLQGDHPDDDGSKLLNVAVSRAREHLVIVANLTYLDDRLPGGALLRDILFQMQSKGTVLDAHDILTLRPADLRGLGRPIDIDIETQQTGLFGQKDFDVVFRADIAMAKKSVVIFSGFVTPERVGSYGDLFRQKILEGVKLRCVTRPPKYNGSIPAELGKQALDALEGIGVVVDCRRDIHQKIAIIDGQVVWFGSLNPLSHTSKTDEVMMRALAPGFASELARQVAIRSGRRDGDSETASIQSENPRCGTCGGRTFYFFSRRLGRSYFACENDCDWVQDVTSSGTRQRSQQSEENLPSEGPPCPKCGQTTRRRQGRHGAFYGCSLYPKCNGTMSVRDALKLLRNTTETRAGT